jgi:hypothetical protein
LNISNFAKAEEEVEEEEWRGRACFHSLAAPLALAVSRVILAWANISRGKSKRNSVSEEDS